MVEVVLKFIPQSYSKVRFIRSHLIEESLEAASTFILKIVWKEIWKGKDYRIIAREARTAI